MTRSTRKSRLFARRDVRREEFIDKLRERWIAERAAVTLYGLALERLRVQAGPKALIDELPRLSEQEERHAEMVTRLLAELGRQDPRHEPATPSVNIVASEMGSL